MYDLRNRRPDPEEVRQRLEAFRQRRGYLLPHQGVMAAALPDLQDIYGSIYKILTLDLHHLDSFDREVVWLSLLIAAEEHVGTHHVKLFFEEGGTQAQAEAAFRIAAWSKGGGAYAMLDRHWQKYFPEVPAQGAYIRSLHALLDGFEHVSKEQALLALVSCHTALGNEWPLEATLRECYAIELDEAKIAEAMSLALWPCGVNRFLEGSAVWLHLIQTGQVTPSPAFKAWADTAGQEGMDIG